MQGQIELSSAPTEENCVQVGTEGYSYRAYVECQLFREQLRRHYREQRNQELPKSCALCIKKEVHDFGSYYELVVKFDEADEAAVEAAFWLEANLPMHWDEEAKKLVIQDLKL